MGVNVTGGYVSADSHVVEPADLWTTRMEAHFRDRAPRVEARPEGDYYVIDGVTPTPSGLEGVAIEDKIAGGITSATGYRHADTRPGAWDPHARLADLDLDHIRAEVIYPGGFGLQFWAAPDVAYERECIRVYNDWMSEFCSTESERFLGAGLLPIRGPIEWTIKEAQRVGAMKGIKTLSIPTTPGDRPYSRPDYEPLWTALQEIGLPVSLHIGTGQSITDVFRRLGPGLAFIEQKYVTGIRTAAELIWSGIPQRYPNLRFVIAEGGIGWIASLLGLMDHWWKDHHRWMKPRLDESPSVYFHRQFWATFEDDRAGLLTRELLPVGHLLWGSDYPHTEGTFPHSREQIAKDFAGIPEAEVYNRVAGNAIRLYGLNP